MSLGNNILKGRKELKLSQEQLAEKIGVTRQTISNWELEVTGPTPNQLKLLSACFHTSIDELLDNDANLIIQKANHAEKLIKKQIKFSKIILITIYFLILALLVSYTAYRLTKRDYTKTYQSSFECSTADGSSSIISIIEREQTYIIDADGDEYYAGNSLKEAFESLNLVKKIYIQKGRVCK